MELKLSLSMSSYTCNSCTLQFPTGMDQREHMKSDWHRYNLKRRVAQLPPLDETTFNSKVKVLSEQPQPESNRQMTKKELRRREKEALLEKKKQLLEMARMNILRNMGEHSAEAEKPEEAKEHGEASATNSADFMKTQEPVKNLAKQEHPLEEAQESEQEEQLTPDQLAERLMEEKLANKVEIPLNTCLFCPKREFTSFEENLDHMYRKHGFFIPEQKYLVDKEGLVKYLSEKIGLGNVCLVCSYQGRSLEAVRAHMLSKNHCRIPYETEDERLEISEFYDFSSTYAENNQATSGNDDEWEDINSDEAEDLDDEDEEVPQEYLYNDGVELHLPTGVKVGHRSLQRYYRQNLKPETVLSEGQGTVMAAETRHFATIFDRKQVATQKKVWQTEVKDKKRDDKRSAKFINNQPHYRDQLLQ